MVQANVMLEYSYEEAIEVLETSLRNAREKLVRRMASMPLNHTWHGSPSLT
jgi:hypothetical protein